MDAPLNQNAGFQSDWLRSAIEEAEVRDPVDAANDAEQLIDLLRNHGSAGGVAVLLDPAASHWLKRAYSTALARPAAESISDAAHLLGATQDRVRRVIADHAASRCS